MKISGTIIIHQAIIALCLFATEVAIGATPSLNLAIEAKFDVAGDFSNGLAKVGFIQKDRTLYGYIDRSGKLVIPATLINAEDFSEGLAAVGLDIDGDGNVDRYDYIDKMGKTAISTKFKAAGKFSDGLAAISTGDQNGYIDKTGKIVLQLKYQSLGDFHEGLAVVSRDSSSATDSPQRKYGYINRSGKLVIPLKLQLGGNFSQGLAIAELPNQTRGYINKFGKFVIRNNQLDISASRSFHQQLAGAELSAGACSVVAYCEFIYLDRSGKVVIKPRQGNFTAAGDFAQGLAPVATSGGGRDAGVFYPATGWGFIDKQGKFAIEPQFEDASSFSEGLAKVKINGKYGYIRKP